MASLGIFISNDILSIILAVLSCFIILKNFLFRYPVDIFHRQKKFIIVCVNTLDKIGSMFSMD